MKPRTNTEAIKKLIRYTTIYGWQRALVKVAGRTRKTWLKYFFKATYIKHKHETSLIGCGQFGFSTISYFIQRKKGNVFLDCYDIDKTASDTCSKVWGYHAVESAQEVINNPNCKYIFIASDHYSHTEYAIEALSNGISVHLEKPIAVNRKQLESLLRAKKESSGRLFAGYNRPYSKAITIIDRIIQGSQLPMTLGCFITGHKIEKEHWYRIPKEGTRVCGNIGHWLDLSIHLFNVRGILPFTLDIQIMQSNPKEIDDNLTITYKTDKGDLVTISLTSRNEPFEGINETINLQCGKLNATIDDFRKMTLHEGSNKKVYKFWPKDVGHSRSIMQVFMEGNRDWVEVTYSTLLMLKIKDMVLAGESYSKYDISRDYNLMTNQHI